MSWSLFSQNLETSLVAVAPNPEEEIPAEVLYQHDENEKGQRAHYHGRICVNPDDDAIMIVPMRDGYCYYSGDFGETWDQRGQATSIGVTNTYAVRTMRYHPEEDTWWAGSDSEPSNNYSLRYSVDDGETWTEVTVNTTVLTDHRTYSFNVVDDGTICFQGTNASTAAWAVAKDLDPKVSKNPTSGNRYTFGSLNGSYTYMASGILGDQYFVSVQNYSPEPRLGIAKIDMSDGQYWGGSDDFSNAMNIAMSQTYELDYGLAFLSESTGLVTLSKFYWGASNPLPKITYDFGVDVVTPAIYHGDGVFALIARDASSTTKMYIAFMNTETFVWTDTFTVNLPLAHSGESLTIANRHQLEYFKDGYWLFAYLSTSGPNTELFTLVKFYLPQTQINFPSPEAVRLHNAISSQSPDIYMRMDDLQGVTTVRDMGRQHYTNSAIGTLTFEQTGLVADDGTAVLIDASSNTGVLVESVPTPANHAHVFVLSHDGTASVRILACSGDYSDTGAVGYYVFLAANHKLGVAVYDGGWEYHYSTAALTAATTYLCAVSISSSGKVSFYVGNAWDSAVEDVPYETIASTILSLGGGWTGDETLSQCADGVTVDYYALIPLAGFDYKLLVEANGGTYTGPTVDDIDSGSIDGVVFLVHGNESALDPVIVNSVQVYEAINSVPGSSNRIHNNYSASVVTTDGKFGAGALYVRGGTQAFVSSPWYASYWNEGHLTEIGTQDFTYDVQIKSEWDGGLCYPASSSGLYRRSQRYYRFGGITIKMAKASANTANISIFVGCSLQQAFLGSSYSLELHYLSAPGYIDAAYNHIAVCRHNGAWFVFVNGVKAGIPSVVERNGVTKNTVPILKGGQWLLGGCWNVSLPSQPIAPPRLYTPESKIDEPRLIIGRAEFIEAFTPPTAPYDYG